MISPGEEESVLAKAYVPEHIVSLMGLISKGEPFLIDDYLGFFKDNWLILVGYPLGRDSSTERCEKVLEQVLSSYRPEYLWFIGPEVPSSLSKVSSERETDRYYTLDLEGIKQKASLLRPIEKASRELEIEKGHSFSKEHEALVAEFLKREKLPPRLRELYLAMPSYVPRSKSSRVLNARDRKGRLSAFYVVDLAAKGFATYLLGCYSKKNYVPHASDLLFREMIQLAREAGKETIHLGLGVNDGIRRFKEKWGGVPSLNYEFCEVHYGYSRTASLIRDLAEKL
jgi:hypothetical protein